MRVLILEDDEKMARLYERSLALANHSSVTARDVGNAIEMLTQDGPFDALLVDHFLLQGERGDSLLQFARQKAPNTLRVLISGKLEPEALVDDSAHQVFLRKPVTREQLLSVLERRTILPSPSAPTG
ncbi:MAG: hypothetical protein U0165_19510 [Polyangiaceae bacterium]